MTQMMLTHLLSRLNLRIVCILLAMLFISACASTSFSPFATHYSPPAASLMAQADTDRLEKNYPSAENNIERALRIEPENAHIWLKLGELNCERGNYYDCENLALKGKRLTQDKSLLRRFDKLLKLASVNK